MLTILILLILLTVISAVTFGKINLWHSHFPSPVIWMIITTRRIRVARGTKAWNNGSQILEGKRITWRILLKHKNFLKYRLPGHPLPRESEPADLDWAWESASPMLIQTALKTTLWVVLGQQPTPVPQTPHQADFSMYISIISLSTFYFISWAPGFHPYQTYPKARTVSGSSLYQTQRLE